MGLPLTAAQCQGRIDDIEVELKDLDARLGNSHNLGDTSRAQGIEFQYANAAHWDRKRDYLRHNLRFFRDLKRHLEDPDNNPRPSAPTGITLADVYA